LGVGHDRRVARLAAAGSQLSAARRRTALHWARSFRRRRPTCRITWRASFRALPTRRSHGRSANIVCDAWSLDGLRAAGAW